MIDSILNSVKGDLLGDLTSKLGIGEDKAKKTVDIAGESAQEVMSRKLSSGGLGTVMSLFSNKSNGSSEEGLLHGLKENFIGKVTAKLGIDPSTAERAADMIIPKLTSLITKKNEETPESDSSSITSMFGNLDGVKDSITSKIGNLF